MLFSCCSWPLGQNYWVWNSRMNPLDHPNLHSMSSKVKQFFWFPMSFVLPLFVSSLGFRFPHIIPNGFFKISWLCHLTNCPSIFFWGSMSTYVIGRNYNPSVGLSFLSFYGPDYLYENVSNRIITLDPGHKTKMISQHPPTPRMSSQPSSFLAPVLAATASAPTSEEYLVFIILFWKTTPEKKHNWMTFSVSNCDLKAENW